MGRRRGALGASERLEMAGRRDIVRSAPGPARHRDQGTGDGVAEIKGLSGAMYAELLEFEGVKDVSGMALNLEEHSLKAIILGDGKLIKEGQTVRSTGTVLSIPVSEKLIGRVIKCFFRCTIHLVIQGEILK